MRNLDFKTSFHRSGQSLVFLFFISRFNSSNWLVLLIIISVAIPIPMENTFDDDDDLHLHLHLPQDVLIQILILLPVISLLRFKSVCKSWYALIQSSLFIDLHLNTNSNNNNNNNFGTFIFQTFESSFHEGISEAYMLSGGGGGGEVKLEDLVFPPRHKVSQGFHDVFMVGSCNGIICIHDTKWKKVSLWNPATRQFRLLPKSLTIPGIEDLDQDVGMFPDFVAFGYDVKTKDYKVVQISHFKPYMSDDIWWIPIHKYIFRVQVYSLSTDSWRILEGINSLPAHPVQGQGVNHGVYLNGSYYFLGEYAFQIEIENVTQLRRRYIILSFDLTKEIFTTIQLPHDYHPTTILTYFGEKLAIFASMVVVGEYESDFEFYDIWVLNEPGVKESWTKLHSTVPYFYGRPRGISNNGEFAFIADVDGSLINDVCVYPLKLFNIVTKEVKKELPMGDRVTKSDVYKQSLVSIGRNNTVADSYVVGVWDTEDFRVVQVNFGKVLMPLLQLLDPWNHTLVSILRSHLCSTHRI